MDIKLFLGIIEFVIFADIAKLERQNVALNKTVSSSTIFPHGIWSNLGNIVDGNLDRSGDYCRCCAATALSNNPWITVDLEDEYWIDVVTLYGRTDVNYDYQNYLGLKLYFTQASLINENSTAAYEVEGSGHINFVNISYEEQVHTRYLTFYMPRDSWILSMCEVEVYHGTDCIYGYYGPRCNHTCGQCYNEEPCDDVTGDCRKCEVGYVGSKCDTECTPGTYGQNCSEVCGMCQQNSSCDHVTGICDGGCADGRRGSKCKQECEINTFGENCTSTCHCQDGITCNPYTGICENGACAKGYSGVGCQQKSFENQHADDGISPPIFIGVTAALTCVIIVLGFIVLCLICRKGKNEASEGMANTSNSNTYDELKLSNEATSAYNNIAYT